MTDQILTQGGLFDNLVQVESQERWLKIDRDHVVYGKWDAGRIWWTAEPEHCARLLPDDVILYSDNSFYRVYSPRPGHLSMWKIAADLIDPLGMAIMADADSVAADQSALLGR